MTRLVQGPAVAWLDTGRLGLPPMAAHGHADALAVWFHLAGRPILVDSGTGTYLSDPGWRRWARGAGAHNGLVVDGTDPLVQRGPFQWEAEPDDLWADRASDASSAEGRWTGWRGVRHHRRIELHSGRLEIVDRLDTDRVVEVAFPLHFAPDLALVETGGSHRVVRDGDPVCAIEVARPGLRARCVRGGDPVGPGWVSMRYGERVASTCLWVEGTVSGRWEGRTRLTF